MSQQSRAVAAAVLVSGWQSQGSDGAGAGKEEQVEEWISGTVFRDLGSTVSFFPLQGTQVQLKFKRLKQNSVVCSSIQGLSDLLIPTIKVSTPG